MRRNMREVRQMRQIRDLLNIDINEQRREEKKPITTIKPKQWVNGFREMNPHSLKIHVLNFFISEGHYDVAKKFSQQSGIQMPELNEESINRKLQIKELIKNNKIDEAIKKLQYFKAEQEDIKEKKEIIFHLKSLKVVNCIKESKIEEAIGVARGELIQLASQNMEFMEQIQKIMSLLAFMNAEDCLHYEMTTPVFKNKVLDKVNKFMLEGDKTGEALKILINLTKWSQKRLEDALNIPKINITGRDIFQN